MKTSSRALFLFAASLGAAASAWADPVSVPNLSTTNYYGVNSSSDWNISAGTVDVFGWGGYGFDSPSGSGDEVDLDGSSVGQISTILDLASPGNVTISFWLGANFDGPPATKQLQLTLGGSNSAVLFAPTNPENTWQYENVTFDGVAAGDQLLQFTSLDGTLGEGDDYGPVINDVSASEGPLLNRVPDGASSLLLLLVGGSLLLGLGRRFGRASAGA